VNDEPTRLRQRRDLSAILEAAVAIYRLNFATLIRIAAVTIPLGVAGAALQASVDGSVTTNVASVVLLFLQYPVDIIIAAAIIAALADIEANGEADFSGAYDVAFERLSALWWATIRALVIVLLLLVTIIGIPWAIQRLVRWVFVAQAVILDGTNAKDALSTSAAAVEGRWWRTFGVALLIGLLGAAPAGLAAAVFGLGSELMSGVMASLVSALLLPFTVTAMTLLYLDLQVQKTEAA